MPNTILDSFLQILGFGKDRPDYQLAWSLSSTNEVVGRAMCPYSALTGKTSETICTSAELLRDGTVSCSTCRRHGTVIPYKDFDILQFSPEVRQLLAEFICPRTDSKLAPLYLFCPDLGDGYELKPTLKGSGYFDPYTLRLGTSSTGYPLNHRLVHPEKCKDHNGDASVLCTYSKEKTGHSIPDDIDRIATALTSLGFSVYGVDFTNLIGGDLPKMVFIKELSAPPAKDKRHTVLSAEILWPVETSS